MSEARRRVSRRDFLRLMGAGGGAAVLAACGAPSAPTGGGAAQQPTAAPAAPASGGGATTLKIFNFGGEADKVIYSAAYDRFKKNHPDVTIEDNFVPVTSWSEYTNKVVAQVAGGQAPDIINIAIEGTRLIVSKGLLMPLDDLLTNDPGGKELIADVDHALIDAFKVDGKVWQVPHSWNNMVIYYNTKMFQEAGIEPPKPEWTWQDFLTIAKQLTSGSGGDQVFGFAIPNFNFGLTPWFLTNDTYQLTADWSDSNLNDPKMLESITFVHDLIHVHKVSPAVEGANNEALFTSGKAAMGGWGHWPIQNFLKNDFKDFDVQYWPRNKKATSVHGVGGWGIYTESKNKELAWELIKELTSKETIQATAEAGVAIPARRSVAYSEEFLKFPANSKIFYDSLKDTRAVPSPANFNEFETIFMRHVAEIFAGTVTPEAGLAAAHEELSAAMAKLKG
ncbi:MAG TPA: sugar ABC transporter substrate-binding protein [Roseiflexaceae bacterium]|nr:sugar ABC transporter substrate-binding protein [Roseiflexaceae bacterium]